MRIPGWIDRDVREPVSFVGTVLLPDSQEVAVVVVDVSDVGCRLLCDASLPIASTVKLCLGGKSIDAEVRWALPDSAGLRLCNC